MKITTAIFLNPNQIILIRNLQKELYPALPLLPICIKNEDLHEESKVTKARPAGIYKQNDKIYLKIEMEIDGKESNGTIELCRFLSDENTLDCQKLWESFSTGIKKISPFRLVQIETEEGEKGTIWRVVKEKWKKL